MDREKDVSAFILAGGKSTRMGRDKAFVEFEGRTLLGRALDVARSIASEVQIVGGREKFARYAPVVEDIFQNCGPLAGIHAALRISSTELSLILPVDMPFVTAAFLQYLILQAWEEGEAEVTVPRIEGRWQPLCAVYRREFANAAEKALKAGKYKIDPLFAVVRTRVIAPEELQKSGFRDDLFRNLNTFEELQSEEERER
jgi:molybdenum cofactor guanylyltransferase